MPYSIRKVPKRNCYRVTNTKTKQIRAKCTSKAKAKKQLSLIYALDSNPNFKYKLRNTRRLKR